MLTIHVGLAKTGSTAIQNYLAQAPRKTKHHLIYLGNDNLLGEDGFQVPAAWNSRRSRALGVLADHHNVVISAEEFLGSPWTMYRNARQNAQGLRDYFADRTDFQVVMYLRPQHSYFPSLYNQGIKGGYLGTSGPEEFLGPLIESRYSRYQRLVGDLLDILGPDRLIVRAYVPEDVVPDFLSLIGLPPFAGLEDYPRANEPLNPVQLELLRRMRQAQPTPPALFQARWLCEQIPESEQSRNFSIVPERLQEQIIALTQSDWGTLDKTVQGTRFAQPAVFKKTAEETMHARVLPWIGEQANQEEILREAVSALAVSTPMAWQRKNPIGNRFVRKFKSNPRALPAAVIRVILRRGGFTLS